MQIRIVSSCYQKNKIGFESSIDLAAKTNSKVIDYLIALYFENISQNFSGTEKYNFSQTKALVDIENQTLCKFVQENNNHHVYLVKCSRSYE